MKNQVLGKDLEVGMKVWNNGYKFNVASVKRDPNWDLNGKGRFCIQAEAADESEQINGLPPIGYRKIILALREDLFWHIA